MGNALNRAQDAEGMAMNDAPSAGATNAVRHVTNITVIWTIPNMKQTTSPMHDMTLVPAWIVVTWTWTKSTSI